MKIGWHLVMRLVDGRVIAPSVEDRRRLALSVLRVARTSGLLFFNASGDHLHVAAACPEDRARCLARNLANSLRRALGLGVSFARYHRNAIEDQKHLAYLRGYILGNSQKHAVTTDPHHDASNLPDLLGLRVVGSYTRLAVHERLPSLTRSDLLVHLGLQTLHEGTDLRHLAESAAAAVGSPDLAGNAPLLVAARSAAIRAGRDLGDPPARIRERLGLSARGFGGLASRKPDPTLVQAVRRQMWVREMLATSAPALRS